MKKIYLDNAATTYVKEEVAKEMQKYFLDNYGNPSSLHELGEKASEEIKKARKLFAKEINSKPGEIYFTSCGTESNNLALQGSARENSERKKIIISEIEHPSITKACDFLAGEGYKIVKIPVDNFGFVDTNFLENELKKDTKNILLVSIMHVNNIIGTIQDLNAIGKLCKKYNVVFHTDAVQSFSKLNIDVKKLNIGLLSASGHKINGPKGIGFLYIREDIKIKPLIFGGGQERNLRSGTENVPAIMGFAKALELTKEANKKKIEIIRNKLIGRLEEIGGIINGSKEKRIYDNINVFFKGINAEAFVIYLSQKGIYLSAGSACESKNESDDNVLKAIGLKKYERESSIRITINEDLTEKDVDYIIKEMEKAVKNLKVN